MIQGGVFPEHGSTAETREDGYRADVLDLCGDLAISNIRWPGGCFADVYRWRDGVGGDRPTMPNRMWGKLGKRWGPTEDNRFGTDEFLWYCREVGAEPVICVNAGSADAEEAAAWVYYVNVAGPRQRPDLPTVRLWDVGNELFGWWEKGHCKPRDYARRYLRFRKAMKEVDASIETVPVGADLAFPKWNQGVLEVAGDEIDYLSIHTYLPQDYKLKYFKLRLARKEARYYSLLSTPFTYARKIDGFRAQMRAVVGREIPIAYDEWNLHWWPAMPVYPTGMHLVGLAAAGVLQVFQRNGDIVKVANLSSIINLLCPPILTTRDRAYRTSVFHAMKLMSGLGGDRLVHVDVSCGRYSASAWGGIEGVEGAPLLDVTATRDTTSGRLILFCMNKDFSREHEIEISVDGQDAATAEAHTLRSDGPFSDPLIDGPASIGVVSGTSSLDEPIRLPPHSFSAIVLD